MKSVIIITIIFLSLIIPTISNAYGENLTTKLWFITSNENGCSIWNEQALDFYQSITVQYLPMYDLHGTLIDGKCVRDIDVANDYDEFIKARQSVDLPIIVLDNVIATSQLKIMKTELGHYRFIDDERFGIVFGAFAVFTIEDKKSAWTLSHEISHYALDLKGTPWSVYADWVHEVDTKYDNCNDKQQCTEVWTTVTSPTGQLIPVMKPYEETQTESSSELEKPLESTKEESTSESELPPEIEKWLESMKEEPTSEPELSPSAEELIESMKKPFQSSQTYNVKPSFSNGEILSYRIDPSNTSLILDVKMDGSNAGALRLTLPRDLIDVIGDEGKFFILIDQFPRNYDVISQNSQERIIQFSVPANTEEITVMGNFVDPNAKVIPEFGSIAVFILVTSIITVVVFSRRSKIIAFY